jgi:hypothetical protein
VGIQRIIKVEVNKKIRDENKPKRIRKRKMGEEKEEENRRGEIYFSLSLISNPKGGKKGRGDL